MRKWIRTVTIIGLLLVTVSAAGDGRRYGGRWWETAEVAEALKLNEGEVSQLNQAYDAYSLRMIEIKSRVETERFKLQVLMEKDDLDEAALDDQYNHLEEVRALLSKERFGFFIQARKIIGPQRFHQLMEIYKARRESHKKAESETKN